MIRGEELLILSYTFERQNKRQQEKVYGMPGQDLAVLERVNVAAHSLSNLPDISHHFPELFRVERL